MAKYTAFFNGRWVPSDEIKIDRRDRGFRTGDVVFDSPRTYGGVIFQKERHIDRFLRSLKYARIDCGFSRGEIADIMDEVVNRNRHNLEEAGDFALYIFATRGPGRWAAEAGPPTVGAEASPIDFYRFGRFYDDGAHGVIAKARSYSHQSVDPKIKHQSRMNFNLAELDAADIDPEAYPILTDLDGDLTEGTINSVFLITNGNIRTPSDEDVLQSVSRSTVFDLAEQLGIPVSEEHLQPYDLYTADEAFLAYTGPGVLPMTKVDKRDIGDGKPGPITTQLLAAWSEKVGMDVVDQAQRFSRQ